jgi:DNA-binding winged helix-turn-helix (wHTH) protein
LIPTARRICSKIFLFAAVWARRVKYSLSFSQNIEELRHYAILAEKSAVTGDNTLQSTVNVIQSDLQAIKSQLMNISQPEMRSFSVNPFKNAALNRCKLFVISGARVAYQIAASSDN